MMFFKNTSFYLDNKIMVTSANFYFWLAEIKKKNFFTENKWCMQGHLQYFQLFCQKNMVAMGNFCFCVAETLKIPFSQSRDPSDLLH
jgi:hypothetical protein